jgi:hypothetical protein
MAPTRPPRAPCCSCHRGTALTHPLVLLETFAPGPQSRPRQRPLISIVDPTSPFPLQGSRPAATSWASMPWARLAAGNLHARAVAFLLGAHRLLLVRLRQADSSSASLPMQHVDIVRGRITDSGEPTNRATRPVVSGIHREGAARLTFARIGGGGEGKMRKSPSRCSWHLASYPAADFSRRLRQPSMPRPANTRPGSPAPAMGPGTPAVVSRNPTIWPRSLMPQAWVWVPNGSLRVV